MIRLKQIALFILTMLIVQIPLIATSYAYDKSKIPEYVKIGLRYGESATPLVSLSSKSGLELGSLDNGGFTNIFSFLGNEDVIVRKDSYFMSFNGTFVEYQYDELRDGMNTGIQGPIHVQIGPVFNTKEEAMTQINMLTGIHEKPYLVYENGWRVWVGLYTNTAQAQASVDVLRTNLSQVEISIVPQHNKRIQMLSKNGEVVGMLNVEDKEYHFKPIEQHTGINVMKMDGKNFRGSILFKRYGDSDLTVINRIPLEEYLYGVVPREMSGTWPLEAQKAQAVAARNYAIQNMGAYKKYGFDLSSTVSSQAYGGYDIEHERSRQAVNETKGKLLTYKGALVTAFYHSNSGGHTENSENVWSNPIDYIKGVDDPFSVGAPNDTWTYALTKEQVQDILAMKQISIGELSNMSIIERSPFGRVIHLEIMGTTGKKTLKKEEIRSIFGYNNIKSTWFNLNTDASLTLLSGGVSGLQSVPSSNVFMISAEGTIPLESSQNQMVVSNGSESRNVSFNASQYVFTGKGWGHGLGMSQWGAKKMAEQGYTFEQILTYYYTGTTIE